MGRVLSIFLPQWEVDLLLRRSKGVTHSGPREPIGLLLVSRHGQQNRVARCSPAARAAGAWPGMDLAEARALGRMRVAAFDPERSRQAMVLLAGWCRRFSPAVCVDACALTPPEEACPDGLLLDVTGEAHLFGGEHLMLAEIGTRLRRLGFTARLAVAPTIGAAWAVARFGPHPASIVGEEQIQTALCELAIEALRFSPAISAALREVGIERIRHLLRLRRESLLVRYGEEAVRRLDQAMGRLDELLSPLHPAEPMALTRVFDGAVVQMEAIFLTVEELLEKLARKLLKQERGVRSLKLEFMRINAPPVMQELVIGRASRDHRHLWKLLRSRVERMHMGYGVEAVRLTASWTETIPHAQFGAWERDEGQAHDRAFDALLDTFTNRWGNKRVLAAMPVASHTPEVARHFAPVWERDEETEAVARADRPSLLLEKPEAAEAVALQPDGPPSYLRWRGEGHAIGEGQGPERITTAWWGTRRCSTRDYFKIQLETGAWLWVFRELESGGWFVHGMWA